MTARILPAARIRQQHEVGAFEPELVRRVAPEVLVGHGTLPCAPARSSAHRTTAGAFALAQTAPPVAPASAFTRPPVFL